VFPNGKIFARSFVQIFTFSAKNWAIRTVGENYTEVTRFCHCYVLIVQLSGTCGRHHVLNLLTTVSNTAAWN